MAQCNQCVPLAHCLSLPHAPDPHFPPLHCDCSIARSPSINCYITGTHLCVTSMCFIVDVCPCPDGFEEDKKVKELMAKYGIRNVRGGSYSNVELSAAQQQVLQLELAGATDRCLSSGAHDRFSRNCPQQVVSPSLHLPQPPAAQHSRHSPASSHQPSYPPYKSMRTFVN